MMLLTISNFFFPVHGEYRMLKIHAELSQDVGIPPENSFVLSNGDTILLKNVEAGLGPRIHVEDIYVDGNDISGFGIKHGDFSAPQRIIVDKIILRSINDCFPFLIAWYIRITCKPKSQAAARKQACSDSQGQKQRQSLFNTSVIAHFITLPYKKYNCLSILPVILFFE